MRGHIKERVPFEFYLYTGIIALLHFYEILKVRSDSRYSQMFVCVSFGVLDLPWFYFTLRARDT